VTISSLHLSLISNIFLLHLLYIYAHPHILRKCTIAGFCHIHLYDLCLCILNSTQAIIYIFTQYLRKKYNRKSNFNCDYVHKINKINPFYIILFKILFLLFLYVYILSIFSFRGNYSPSSRSVKRATDVHMNTFLYGLLQDSILSLYSSAGLMFDPSSISHSTLGQIIK
jgi:hypothetical protein